MHIDYDNLSLVTESDVEQKIIIPLLAEDIYLGIPAQCIFTKDYLAPTVLDKSAGRGSGYYPDYSIWMRAFPVLIIEAKAPEVPAEEGYREASLYARHLNQQYPTSLNPCRFVLATNGKILLAGYWDAPPVLAIEVPNLRVGFRYLSALHDHCGRQSLEAHAGACLSKSRGDRAHYPYDIAGGQALLNARRPLNSFAADLSPILGRYFSSSNEDDNREIIERAYVSSHEVTEYDRILEALLKERLISRDTVVQQLQPGRHEEKHVADAISEFDRSRPKAGHLQIVQGSVGSGKSLFIRRYKELLQPQDQLERFHWAFVDFNTGPADLAGAERWLCRTFVESFERENPTIDMSAADVLRGMFSRNIQRKRTIYSELAEASPSQAAVARAEDLSRWRDDPEETARGLAEYVLGSRHEVLVAVMDNVDRLDLKSQLQAFQLALWFMNLSHAFVILQMRDESYERFKNQPPLDTFRTAITFHITAPRFIDVVKKRLELSLEYLASEANERQFYAVESGARISYPKSDIGYFLRDIYIELFARRRNISRLLEALAGRDVRRALEMFVSIITSGHLSAAAVTSAVLGVGGPTISERNILKILMRTGYQFFSDQSGFISNIFTFDPDWQKPDNFILIEILFFLARNRKRRAEIGLEGYFTCRHIANALQPFGYVPDDVLAALGFLLRNHLISADHMNFTSVDFNDSVRILASGFMHVRILSDRIEYLYGITATTPIVDQTVARRLADFVHNESVRGELAAYQKLRAVEMFRAYLLDQKRSHRTPFSNSLTSGADYVLHHMANGIQHAKNVHPVPSDEPDPLDF